jgi:hypothetical protein
MAVSHVLFACCVLTASAVDQTIAANPIRKVVSLLQNMEKKVNAEGEKEQKMYDKFMCYCKNAGGDLSKSIADADAKATSLPSEISEGEAKLKQLKEELKGHQTDRSAAKAAIAEATAIREKEAAAFAKEKAESTATITAVNQATAAISKGMSGSFLQTSQAQLLKKLMLSKDELDADRQDVLAFLSGTTTGGYAPQGGEIVGILKTMEENMAKSLAQAEAAEAAAVSSHAELVAAKEKEVEANTQAIETKQLRVGDLAVSIAEMKNDLSGTQKALEEDKAFLADLDGNCAKQTKAFEANRKIRSEELVALADTIKVLNDDDALDLFKKALPGASMLIQMSASKVSMQQRAVAMLREASQQSPRRAQLDFITMAIQGKKIGFEKVIKMIDNMVATLKKEQNDDEHKKEYCQKQFDVAEDKKKVLTKTVSDTEVAIEDANEGISTLAAEIEALEDGIKALDKSVAEATANRKDEHSDFTELMASDAAAKELLKFAKNRLNKFYNPALYKPPPKRELTEEERITVNNGGTLAPTAAPGGIAGTGVTVLAQSEAAPAAPPQAVGAYKKKGEESGGVIAMINLLVQDLDKEMTEAKVSEENAQEDYEQMLKDSAEKRATDSKALTEKNAAKAGLQADVEASTDAKGAAVKELMATEQYISSLHAECDWLLQYFDTRKEARTSEIESLTTAKSVLSGADFSLIQENRRAKFLRGQVSM